MAKKSATYLDYEVIVEDNSSITVKKGGQHIPNVMGAIREIASITGYVINEKSNTRQNGAKLVDHLKALPAETATQASEAEAAPAAEPEPTHEPEPSAPETAPTPQATSAEPIEQEQNQTSETEELGEEEMKQIDDLIKRLEALEARIAKLESGATAAPASGQQQDSEKLSVIKTYYRNFSHRKYSTNGTYLYDRDRIKQALDYQKRNKKTEEDIKSGLQRFISEVKGKIARADWSDYSYEMGCRINYLLSECFHIYYYVSLLSDNKIYYMQGVGHDLNALKTITNILNIDVPKGTRKEKLAAELVSKYGNGKNAIISGYLVTIEGSVYSLEEYNINKILNDIKKYEDTINENFNVTTPLKIDGSMTLKEKLDSITDYFEGLTRKVEPVSLAAQAEEFERVAKEVFNEAGYDL